MSSSRYVVGGLAIAIVFSAVVAGLIVVGSPGEERLRRLDDRRVRDLVGITHGVNDYWTKNATLPASLDVLRDSPGGAVSIVDPLTGHTYSFEALGGRSYELCAEFQHESTEADARGFGRFWSHGVGRRCFQLDAEDTRK